MVNSELQSSKNAKSANKKQCAFYRNRTKNKNCKGEKGTCFYVTDHNHQEKKKKGKNLKFATGGPASLSG